MLRATITTALLALALATSGCEINKFCLDCASSASDGGTGRDGGGDAGVIPDAGPDHDACLPAGAEQCNGVDDDCDGEIDEDAAQVGDSCGTDVGACSTGTYECTDGELVCAGAVVLPQPESCNGIDDDCDGTIDDGDPGGGMVCGSDIGECQRGITACVGGEVICSGEVLPRTEVCDLIDNDCDGDIDEGNPEGGAACGESMGDCMPGTIQCIGGALVCIGGDGPSFELCDGADNDCDGLIDEIFDFDNDPNHCGDCTTVCAVDHGQPGCSSGDCAIAFCFTGWWDLDGEYANGCEYACDFAGDEVCNGVDDDCDGVIDEPADLTPPAICNTINECAGTVATCAGTDGWRCIYGPTVSTDADGDIIPETDCDGLDNDCDGVADDAFPTLGDPCGRGLGECATTGTIVCNGSMDGIVCNAPTPPMGTAEVCDGLDNDCDGVVDDGAPDDWVQIGGALWIYRYEASRPDADASSQGVMSHRSCSAANRRPWTNVTHPEAAALCATVGARLCAAAEWQQACQATSGTCDWSYSSSCTSYQPNTCNGNDYDFSPAPGDQDGLLATGALAACYANWGGTRRVFDMSGNVKEWTAQRSAGVNPLRGGSFNNTAVGTSCDFDFVLADDSFQFENVGFRCCRTSAP